MTESRAPSSEPRIPAIAIDGPGGSGKGTISRLLAEKLGFHLLDSGALYRLVALAAIERGVPADRVGALAEIAVELDADFKADSRGDQAILLDGRDVSAAIRAEAVGEIASQIAALPEVREALLARQRAFHRSPGLVADGRDMGTRVFPDAQCKIFLTASPEERARRRYKQLKGQGISANLDTLLDDLAQRDVRDAQRAVAPLEPAGDAVVLDTTGLDIDAVLAQALVLARERIPGLPDGSKDHGQCE